MDSGNNLKSLYLAAIIILSSLLTWTDAQAHSGSGDSQALPACTRLNEHYIASMKKFEEELDSYAEAIEHLKTVTEVTAAGSVEKHMKALRLVGEVEEKVWSANDEFVGQIIEIIVSGKQDHLKNLADISDQLDAGVLAENTEADIEKGRRILQLLEERLSIPGNFEERLQIVADQTVETMMKLPGLKKDGNFPEYLAVATALDELLEENYLILEDVLQQFNFTVTNFCGYFE